jgi:hypothetical protein
MNNENLKPFKPGQCGNPKGRPKGSKSLTGILRAYMDKELEIDDPIEKKRVKKRIGDIINLKLISNAIKGDDRAIKQVFERLEGMPTQKVDQTTTHKTFYENIITKAGNDDSE